MPHLTFGRIYLIIFEYKLEQFDPGVQLTVIINQVVLMYIFYYMWIFWIFAAKEQIEREIQKE